MYETFSFFTLWIIEKVSIVSHTYHTTKLSPRSLLKIRKIKMKKNQREIDCILKTIKSNHTALFIAISTLFFSFCYLLSSILHPVSFYTSMHWIDWLSISISLSLSLFLFLSQHCSARTRTCTREQHMRMSLGNQIFWFMDCKKFNFFAWNHVKIEVNIFLSFLREIAIASHKLRKERNKFIFLKR